MSGAPAQHASAADTHPIAGVVDRFPRGIRGHRRNFWFEPFVRPGVRVKFGGIAARAGFDQGDCRARPRELDRQCAAGGSGANYADIELVLGHGCETSMVRVSEWPRQPSECLVGGRLTVARVLTVGTRVCRSNRDFGELRAQRGTAERCERALPSAPLLCVVGFSNSLAKPYDEILRPEARGLLGEKSDMSAVLRGDEPQIRIWVNAGSSNTSNGIKGSSLAWMSNAGTRMRSRNFDDDD